MAEAEHHHNSYLDKGKDDITLMKLLQYNLLFFVPLLLAIVIAYVIAENVHEALKTTVATSADIILLPLIFIVFLFIIPYIRHRENVKGVRMSLFGFLIVAFTMTIPPMFAGMYEFLLRQFIFIASYILLVFIFCPEVLGVSGDIQTWFKKGKQLIIIGVYLFIVLFYVFGFAYLYFSISNDPVYPDAFDTPEMPTNFERPTETTYADMVYYSIITFATIGYGDITPLSPAARLVASTEAVIGMIMNVLFIAILLVYVSNSQSLATAKEEKKLEAEERKIEKEEQKLEETSQQISSEEQEEQELLNKIHNHELQ